MSYAVFPNVQRGYTPYKNNNNNVITKAYVDEQMSSKLDNYTLEEIFKHFGVENIENHLRKLKLKRIYGKHEDK